MAGLSGAGLDQLLYPNVYGREQHMTGRYAHSLGASRGGAEQGFRDDTWAQREQGQMGQAQGYGQMLNQLAMLAAYMKQQRGGQMISLADPQMQQTPGQPMQQGQGMPQPPQQQYPNPSQPRRSYDEPVRR